MSETCPKCGQEWTVIHCCRVGSLEEASPDPEKQYWSGDMTKNVVWLLQIMVHDSEGWHWSTHSVWGKPDKEAEERIRKSYWLAVNSIRFYGVPCYGEMAKFLGERGWGQGKCPRCTWDGDKIYQHCEKCSKEFLASVKARSESEAR